MNDQNPSQMAKRRQLTLAMILLAVIGAISAFSVWLTADTAPAPGITNKSDIKTKSYIAPGEKVDPQDAWRGVSDNRLTQLEDRLGRLETENTALKKEKEGREKDTRSAAAAGKAQSTAATPEGMSDADLEERLKAFQKQAKDYPPGSPDKPEGKSAGRTAAPAPGNQADPRRPGPGTPAGAAGNGDFGDIEVVKLRPAAHAPGGQQPNFPGGVPAAGASSEGKRTVRTTQNYLPSGMFGRAKILSGLDAPTAGQAQSNPHPVLLELIDLAVLPNAYRYDWKRCFVVGAGHGELSSERALIRTETLSCIGKDGREVLDVPIKGFIAGEDGKAGVRGRVVSKQGAALANALLAGVVSGIGSGLEKAATTTSVNPLGSTTSVKPGSEMKAGLGEGVGKALDRIAQYYLNLADKMFPVIEVDADRVVDVVLTKGVVIDGDAQQP
jgi:conjugal transfer pilus assembly protein TraB